MFIKEYENITIRVRRLRADMTPSERQIWNILKGRRLLGHKFRRQHPIFVNISQNGHRTYYIIDFFCAELKLAVEIDGSIHAEQIDYDLNRDKMLQSKGIHVLRILNEEVSNLESVSQTLHETIRLITKNKTNS